MGATTGFCMLALAATQFVAASPALITLDAPLSVFPPSDTLSAVVLGVDAQNRTTYGIYEHEVMSQGTQVFAATLVQGADHAKYTLSLGTATIGYDCALSAGNAVCSSLDAASQQITSTEALTSGLVLNVASVTAVPSRSGSVPAASAAQPSTKGSILGALVSLALAAYPLA